jgi:hypothetical protein
LLRQLGHETTEAMPTVDGDVRSHFVIVAAEA